MYYEQLYLRVCSEKIFRIMKLTNLLFLVTVFNVFGSKSYSQNTKLNLDMKDVPIQTVFSAIEGQSEFFFLYSSKMIDVTQKVDIKAENENINEVLDKLLANSDIKYSVKDRQILLVNKETEATLAPAKQNYRNCYRQKWPYSWCKRCCYRNKSGNNNRF